MHMDCLEVAAKAWVRIGPCVSSACATRAASSHLDQILRSSRCNSGNLGMSAGFLRRARPSTNFGLQTAKSSSWLSRTASRLGHSDFVRKSEGQQTCAGHGRVDRS